MRLTPAEFACVYKVLSLGSQLLALASYIKFWKTNRNAQEKDSLDLPFILSKKM